MGILGNYIPALASNPIYQGFDQNRNTIGGFANGLLTGANPQSYVGPVAPAAMQANNPMANAIAGGQQGAQMDKQVQQDAQAQNATVAALAKYPDLAGMVASKAITPQQAAIEMFKRQSAASDSVGAQIQQRMDAARKIGVTGNDLINYGLTSKMPDMWQPLTADERVQAGIPVTDTTPYQKNSQGQIKAIGSTSGGANAADDGTAQSIADGITKGITPPTTAGLYKYGAPVKAILAKQGYDFTKANEDYTATSKLLSTMNGAQQTRLRQSVQQVSDTLGLAKTLADQWDASGFPPFNKGALLIAANDPTNPAKQSLATRLIAQVADVTSDLGTVYKGGNSSTDESLKLAATQLSADWSRQTFDDAVKQAQQNIAYRLNSLNLATAGIPNSQYNQMPAASGAAPAVTTQTGPATTTTTGPTDPATAVLYQKYGITP